MADIKVLLKGGIHQLWRDRGDGTHSPVVVAGDAGRAELAFSDGRQWKYWQAFDLAGNANIASRIVFTKPAIIYPPLHSAGTSDYEIAVLSGGTSAGSFAMIGADKVTCTNLTVAGAARDAVITHGGTHTGGNPLFISMVDFGSRSTGFDVSSWPLSYVRVPAGIYHIRARNMDTSSDMEGYFQICWEEDA